MKFFIWFFIVFGTAHACDGEDLAHFNSMYLLSEISSDNEYVVLVYVNYADNKLREGDLLRSIQLYETALGQYKVRMVDSPMLLEKIISSKKYAEYLYVNTDK